MTNIEYVIYCRKSTDESSDNQKQSIPDQIKACIDYAKREGLTIKKKPKDFSLFESETEIEKEDHEGDIMNHRIFKETRDLFIIKEQETAKIPGKRKKWKALIDLVNKEKINGIISYAPDRQARNMLEAGQIIDLLDQNKLKENKSIWKTKLAVKYPNFHYEDNASWKMMLGIWFVFSKQYSDNLSDVITRWNNSKITSWKAIWKHKPGYFINDEWFHEPHPKYFPIIKEAFKMKLDGEIESKIREYINANWYRRTMQKTWEEKEIWKNWVNSMFLDEFYYWMLINWESVSDLRDTNPYYQPIITDEQHQLLKDRHSINPLVVKKTRTKDIYEDIKVFDVDFIFTEDNYWLTFSLPNKKRYTNKIEKANLEWKIIEFKDVVKPNQIIYRCANKESKYYNLSVTLEEIDNAILKLLKTFKIWEKEFEEYVKFTHTKLDDIEKTSKEKIASKNLEIGRLKSEKTKYIKNNMSYKKDSEENEIYENTKIEFDKKINLLRKEIEALDEWERNEIVELEIFVDVLNNAYKYYKHANYVQKRKIAKILFLNMKINHEKRLQIQVKPEFETLFNPSWWSTITELRTFFENNKEYSITELYAEKYNDYHEYKWKPIEYYRRKKKNTD